MGVCERRGSGVCLDGSYPAARPSLLHRRRLRHRQQEEDRRQQRQHEGQQQRRRQRRQQQQQIVHLHLFVVLDAETAALGPRRRRRRRRRHRGGRCRFLPLLLLQPREEKVSRDLLPVEKELGKRPKIVLNLGLHLFLPLLLEKSEDKWGRGKWDVPITLHLQATGRKLLLV